MAVYSNQFKVFLGKAESTGDKKRQHQGVLNAVLLDCAENRFEQKIAAVKPDADHVPHLRAAEGVAGE